MKTNSIKRFEKDLIDNGYRFKLIKQLRDTTRYDISKDGYTYEKYEAYNVLDDPKYNFKFFEQSFNMFKKIEEGFKKCSKNSTEVKSKE